MPLLLAAAALCACGSSERQQQNAAPANADAAAANAVPPPLAPPLSDVPAPPLVPEPVAAADATNGAEAAPADSNVAAPSVLPDSRDSDAAKALAQRFIDLLNHGQFGEAYMLLGSAAPPRGDFDRQFAGYSDLHVTMGTPGEPEGAAGSTYMSVPAKLSGSLDGKAASKSITIVLRRVNDVAGSTAAQRRWHVERVDTP